MILGFPPGEAGSILADSKVSGALEGKLIISMLAGVSCEMIAKSLGKSGPELRLVRVTPSVGAQISESCSLVS